MNNLDSSGVFATGSDKVASQEIERNIEVCMDIPQVLSIERTSVRTARYAFNQAFHNTYIAGLIFDAQRQGWPEVYGDAANTDD